MLKAGSSKPWPEILMEMTNKSKMSADPILEYFKPLENWLDEIISQNNITVGWKSTIDDYFPKSTTPTTTSTTTTPTTTSTTTPMTTPTTESKSGKFYNHYYQISIVITAVTILISFGMLF